MKNLSKIYKELDLLRFKKKSFQEIERILIRKGYDRADVREIVDRTEQREHIDFHRLKDDYDGFSFKFQIVTNVGIVVVGFVFLSISFYFFSYLYKFFNTSVDVIERSGLGEADQSGGLLFVLMMFGLGFMFLYWALSVFRRGIYRIQKTNRNRKRYLYLIERMTFIGGG